MENTDKFKVFAAPVQGLTELPWRHFHHSVYRHGIDAYFTPFLRIERGEVRRRDVRDISSPLNASVPTIPQIIFRDMAEFDTLCNTVRNAGYSSIDINMGCPFPPQVHHGRGAGMMSNLPLLSALASTMRSQYHDIKFSLKMRLGVDSPAEWRQCIGAINSLPLTHVTVHARTAHQQYSGELAIDEFAEFLHSSHHPVIFNGDIRTPEDIERLRTTMPTLAGVMIGRGLFSRPSLAEEWIRNTEWTDRDRAIHILRLHDAIYDYYLDCLSGDSQLISKLKPFWDYLQGVDKRTLKLMKKATTLAKYNEAVTAIRHDLTGKP